MLSKKRLLAVVAGMGVIAMTMLGALQAKARDTHDWAAGLAGCHPSQPAIAFHGDQTMLDPQPTKGPVPCGMLTGWSSVETRIEVTNTNTVIYEPALQGGPVLAGDGHTPGWGKEESIARTTDGGTSWDAVSVPVWPDTYLLDGQVDNNLYVDHDTGRIFWYMYDPKGGPQVPYTCGGGGGTVAFSNDSGTTWAWGVDHDHICAENPFNLTAKPRVTQPWQLSYKNIVYLCGDNTSTGVATTGTPGYSCSKSVNGGVTWLGTTLNGQGFYSGQFRDHVNPYPQCSGQSSSATPNVQPLPDGTLVVVVTCNSNTFLSESADEGATWSIVHQIPHGGQLRIDSGGNMYLLRKATASNGNSELLVSHSTAGNGGANWSREQDMVDPGVVSVGTFNFAQGTFAPGQVGHVAVTYYGIRKGNTTSDGFISETRDALDDNPVFWSGQVNDPKHPLLYNTQTDGNIGITVLDFNGGALSPDGRSVWGSWVQDCGANVVTDPNCQARFPSTNPTNPDSGFAGRLVWP